MVKLTLFLMATLAICGMFLFVTSDCRMSRNIHSAVKDGSEGAWKETVGRAQQQVEQASYDIRYKVEDTGAVLKEGAKALDQKAVDATITAAVKMKLANADNVSASRINVDTKDGVVYLKGFVSSQAEADVALELPMTVEGVNDVVSQLKIRREQFS